MSQYILAYHGGSMPETEEEGKRVMGLWMEWFGKLGEAVVDGGNPVGQSSTIHSDGSVTDDGGSNPLSGYSVIEADSMEHAIELSKGCPILLVGGSIEVAMVIDLT